MSTCRPFSWVSHFAIYFQGHHSSNSSLCSHRQNLSTCLQGARWAQGLLTWSVVPLPIFWQSDLKLACPVFLEGSYRHDSKPAKLSSTRGHDTGSLAMGRRRCSLGCAMGGDKCGNAGLSSDTSPSDALYTGKSPKVLLLSRPKLSWASPKPWAKSRPSKPPPTTEFSHGLKPRQHRNAPGWMLLLTHHQLHWHQGHQRAEAKTDSIYTSLSKHHSPSKTFSPE